MVKKFLVVLTTCLVMPISGFAQYQTTGFTVVLTPPIDKFIQIVNCSSANNTARWQCVIKNKTDATFDMARLFATCYDRDGVKNKEGGLYDTIDANGSSKVGLCGHYSEAQKVVITKK